MMIRWIAHEAAAINLNIRQLQQAETVKQALTVAPTLGMPTQNLVVADHQGEIGWCLAGPLYARSAEAGRFAQYSDQYNEDMALLSADQYPAVINPVNQRIWTANAPVLTGYNQKNWLRPIRS